MNTLTKIFINILITFTPFLCNGQDYRLDTLISIIENKSNTGYAGHPFHILIHTIVYQKNNAVSNVRRIKMFYGDKELKKVETQYRITQSDVKKYLDTMLFFLKDQDYKYQFEQFNSQLEKTLYSIRKLNLLFYKYSYSPPEYKPIIIIEKSSTIKKTLKYTSKWGSYFSDYHQGIDPLNFEKSINRGYWFYWEDERFIVKETNLKRKSK